MEADVPAKTIPLSKTTKFIVDNRGRTAPTAEYGIPLIATNCISNDRLYPSYDKLRFVSKETYDTWFRSHPLPGDIILTNKGSQNGAICLVPDPVDFVIAQDMVALRADEKVIDPYYLFAALRSSAVQREIKNLDVSGVIPHFKKTDFDKLHLPYPKRDSQESIGRIYFNLCAKIELNRRMNATLEAMARALFQSWFVDFDPVRANTQGRPPAGLDEHTAALFPAQFQDSELGEIPVGWTVGSLGEVAANPRRGVDADEINGATAYIGLEHMPRGCIALSDWDTAEGLESNKSEFKRGGILFGKLRPYFHKVGVAPLDGVCSTDILVISPAGAEWFGFVLGHVSSVELVNHTNAMSTGTKMPRTKWQDLAHFQVVLPPAEITAAFTRLIDPLVKQIVANIHQSHTLATLRDTLLPKLLSGSLSISTETIE